MSATTTGLSWRSAARTDAGLARAHNEDAFVDRPGEGLWAVADGMGGHSRGEVASGRLREALAALAAPADLEAGAAAVREAVRRVHDGLGAEAGRGGGVPGSTVVALLAAADGRVGWLWAGDSRLYRLRAGRLERLTRDHSLVEDLVAAGALAPEDARSHPLASRITRAVGAGLDPPELEAGGDAAAAGDVHLLCSDGLHGVVADAEIAAVLLAAGPDLDGAADALVAAALRAGAPDNVTVVLAAAASRAAAAGPAPP